VPSTIQLMSRLLLGSWLLACASCGDDVPKDGGAPRSFADAASGAVGDAGDSGPGNRGDGGDGSRSDAGEDSKRDGAVPSGDGAVSNADGGTGKGDGGGVSDAGVIPLGLPFSATFDNSEEYARNFQIEILHGTGAVTAQAPSTREWAGDHNASCEAPTTTRTLRVDQPTTELMYWCPSVEADSGHIHTSMRTTGFALVSFAPNRPFNNVHKICWDMSMTNLGGRRFPQLTVVPESEFQANGGVLAYTSGANAIGTSASHFIDGSTFLLEMLNGSTVVFVGSATGEQNFSGFVNGTDKLRRFKNCVTDNEDGTLTFSLQRSSSTESRTHRGSMPNGAVRVIFADHNYNPPKDPPPTQDPNTMHWDNIQIE
jgi:hypothetical protein